MTAQSERAHAKLNLALHVRSRRADGYHELDTLFAFTRDGDELFADLAKGLSLTITGPQATGLSAGADNLVFRAARALAAATGCRQGARLRLVKTLPVASGIGGGSADAAATLRLLARLWHVAVPDGVAASLGADVPACLASTTGFATGLGWPLEAPEDAAELGGIPVLLLNPGVALSTAAVFRAWDGVDRGALGRGPALATAIAGRNDLEPPAIALAPSIAGRIAFLRDQPGVVLARMSGSGATCFALFDDAARRDAAAAAAAAIWPGDWRLATALI